MQRIWLSAAPLTPLVVAVVSTWGQPPAAGAGDYAQYLLHAQAIAEGRPYGDIGYLYTPLNALHGPAAQPPGWPLLLAPVVAAVGHDVTVLRGVMLALTAALIVAVAWQVSASFGPAIGFSASAIFGTALVLSRAPRAPGADIPFALIGWLLIVAAHRRGEWTWPRLCLLLTLATAGALVKVAGLAFLPAILLAGMLRSAAERRRAVVAASFTATGLLALFVVGGDLVPFLRDLPAPPSVMVDRMVASAVLYPRAIAVATLYPLPSNSANDVYHALMLGLVLIGAATEGGMRLRRPIAAMTLVYALMLAVAPVQELRYVWMFYPLVVTAALVGLSMVAARVLRPPQVSATIGVVATLICAGATVEAVSEPPVASLQRSEAAQDLFEWVRHERDTQPIRALFENPRVLTLSTGAAGMPPVVASPESLQRELERLRITHVITGAVDRSSFNLEAMAALSPLLPQWREVFRNDVYRVFALGRR